MEEEVTSPDTDRPTNSAARPSPNEVRAFTEAWQSRPGFEAPAEEVGVELPAPVYTSWEDYLARTTERERLQWCRVKAKTASRERLMSGRPERRVTPLEVWQVAEGAQGRCVYCGSLALERRPTGHDGRPMPWAMVGRRIGSLDHRVGILDGGTNDLENLAWACLWCNVWETERRPGATDHGGLQRSDQQSRLALFFLITTLAGLEAAPAEGVS